MHSEPKFLYRVLPASEIAVGHCVILNHVDQPCAKLVAIIVKRDTDGFFYAKYLNKELQHINGGRPVRVYGDATPVGEFGVEVLADMEKYWCKQIAGSRATYSDGKLRCWQDTNPDAYYKPLQALLFIKTPSGEPGDNTSKGESEMSKIQEQAKYLLPIVQALADGKQVQWSLSGQCNYRDLTDIAHIINTNLRIKPEPKLRPYTREEWEKVHRVRNKNTRISYPVGMVRDDSLMVNDCTYNFDEVIWYFEHLDGTPCGVLVEDA